MAYEFILLSDEIREKMFDYLKPAYKRKYDLDVASINWTTGIYDKESGIFLTKIYFVSDGIARCGIHYNSYIVITDSGNVFTVTNNDEFEKGTYDFRIPKQYVTLIEKVKEGIDYYEDNNYKCKRTLNDDIKRKLDEINNIMDDRCHRNFLVNCEEDAHKLFIHVDCNIHTILDIYNKKTINDFKKFATDNKVMFWKSNRYLQLLNKVRSADITNQERCQSFNKACSFIWNGVIDTYDKQFFETVKYMYDTCIMSAGNESSLERYIIAYADKYSDKIKNIIPMIEFVYAHTEKRYLKGAIENVKNYMTRKLK